MTTTRLTAKQKSDAVEQVWLNIYRNPKKYFDLYQLGEELTNLKGAFRLWRFRRVITVKRIIQSRRGTSGVGYPRRMLEVVLFPEIWKLRKDLWVKQAASPRNACARCY